MVATIVVESPAKRRSVIEHSEPLPDRSFDVRFRGDTKHFRVHQIPIEVPVYRLANMRTLVDQETYIADRNAPADFFNNGQENPSAQQAQHRFLVELARDPSKNIYNRLKEDPHSDPLVVTQAGMVVNGNRRLAAMRELRNEDPRKFASFSHVEVVVLPGDASESDITALETDLQIVPDLKLEYGWVQQALGLRRQLQTLGWSLKDAAARWRETEADMATLISQLSLAEQYLEFIGKPRRYDLVAADDLAFERLAKMTARSGISPQRAEAERLIGFALVEKKRLVAGRIWDYAGRIDKIATLVFSAPELRPAGDEQAMATTDDPLSGVPNTDEDVSEGILRQLRDHDLSEIVAKVAEDAFDEIRDEEKRTKRGARFGRDAAKLNSDVSRISLQDADDESLTEGATQLLHAAQRTLLLLKQLVTSHPDKRSVLDAKRLADIEALVRDLSAKK